MVAQRLIRMAAAAVLVTAGLPLAALNARAASGDSIGDARTIVSVVKADFEKQERSLSVGDNVRQNEVIETKHMLSAYNSRLRAYLLEHHVMDTATLFQISGTDLIQKFGYRECPLSANK